VGTASNYKRECHTSPRTNVLDFTIVDFWNSKPEEIVSAPSVNSFKRCSDKEYACLCYCTYMDYMPTRQDRSTGITGLKDDDAFYCILNQSLDSKL